MLKRNFGVVLGAYLAALSFAAVANDSKDDLNTGVSGSFACQATHFSSTDYTGIGLRNYSETATINFTRVRVFDANAVLVFDSSVSAMPINFKPTLTAHQSTAFTTTDLFGSVYSHPTPMQVHIDWVSADSSRVLPPQPGWARFGTGISGSCRMTSLVTRLPAAN